MLLPPGWANAPLSCRERGSSDDQRQRGTDNPCCGSFRETQVTETGRKAKKRRKKQTVFSLTVKKRKVPRVLRCHFSLQDCLLGSARCILFQCPLHSFSGQAVLKIQARLWNSSFIEVPFKTQLALIRKRNDRTCFLL